MSFGGLWCKVVVHILKDEKSKLKMKSVCSSVMVRMSSGTNFMLH